ncbi:MAG: hypothetical protein AB8H79_23555 [Myxococcota bacterium]
MTRRVQLRWLMAAIAGVLLALFIGFFLLPTAIPVPATNDVVVMDDLRSSNVVEYRPRAAPIAAAQPVPEEPVALPGGKPENWERVHDRADWVGGAVVTCDLSSFEGRFQNAFINFDEGLKNAGAVDIISRAYTPVIENRITFTVTEETGEARIALNPAWEDPDEDIDGASPQPRPGFSEFNGVPARITWSGAVPGSTVGCTSAVRTESARITILLVDDHGQRTGLPMAQGGGTESLLTIRGCGMHFPMESSILELQVEAGRCGLQVERRNATVPLIVSRSPVHLVNLQPGEERTIELPMPDSPPLYQPPDMLEVSTAADIAAFFGADVAADLLEEALLKLANGEWNAETLEELGRELDKSRADKDDDQRDEAMEDLIEDLDSPDSRP